jgi:hypothetical protein
MEHYHKHINVNADITVWTVASSVSVSNDKSLLSKHCIFHDALSSRNIQDSNISIRHFIRRHLPCRPFFAGCITCRSRVDIDDRVLAIPLTLLIDECVSAKIVRMSIEVDACLTARNNPLSCPLVNIRCLHLGIYTKAVRNATVISTILFYCERNR